MVRPDHDQGRKHVEVILRYGAEPTEEGAKLRRAQRRERRIVDGDLRAATRHAVNDFNPHGALLPIPAQVVVIGLEHVFPGVPITRPIPDISDERRGRVHQDGRLQNRAAIEQRHQPEVHTRLRGDHIAQQTLAAGRQRDDCDIVGLPLGQAGEEGGGHVADIGRVRKAVFAQPVENPIADDAGGGACGPGERDELGGAGGRSLEVGRGLHRDGGQAHAIEGQGVRHGKQPFGRAAIAGDRRRIDRPFLGLGIGAELGLIVDPGDRGPLHAAYSHRDDRQKIGLGGKRGTFVGVERHVVDENLPVATDHRAGDEAKLNPRLNRGGRGDEVGNGEFRPDPVDPIEVHQRRPANNAICAVQPLHLILLNVRGSSADLFCPERKLVVRAGRDRTAFGNGKLRQQPFAGRSRDIGDGRPQTERTALRFGVRTLGRLAGGRRPVGGERALAKFEPAVHRQQGRTRRAGHDFKNAIMRGSGGRRIIERMRVAMARHRLAKREPGAGGIGCPLRLIGAVRDGGPAQLNTRLDVENGLGVHPEARRQGGGHQKDLKTRPHSHSLPSRWVHGIRRHSGSDTPI